MMRHRFSAAGSPPRPQDARAPQAQFPRSPTLKELQKSARLPPPDIPAPAGANFPQLTLLLGGWRCKSDTGEAYVHMLNFTYKDAIKIKNKHDAGISRTFYLSTETIRRPPQSRETIHLK
jgi:hypothetical protein